MANPWSTSHQDNVHSTPDGLIPAAQWQYIPGPETYAAQGCPCSICSRASYDDQTAGQTIEHQDPRVPVESIVAYANPNFGSAHPTGIAATVDDPVETWSVAPQAPVLNHILCSLGPVELELQQNQENVNAGYAPLPEAVGPVPIQSGAVPNKAQAIDMSVPSVFGVLLGAMSTIQSRSLTVSTWNLILPVDFKLWRISSVEVASKSGAHNVPLFAHEQTKVVAVRRLCWHARLSRLEIMPPGLRISDGITLPHMALDFLVPVLESGLFTLRPSLSDLSSESAACAAVHVDSASADTSCKNRVRAYSTVQPRSIHPGNPSGARAGNVAHGGRAEGSNKPKTGRCQSPPVDGRKRDNSMPLAARSASHHNLVLPLSPLATVTLPYGRKNLDYNTDCPLYSYRPLSIWVANATGGVTLRLCGDQFPTICDKQVYVPPDARDPPWRGQPYVKSAAVCSNVRVVAIDQVSGELLLWSVHAQAIGRYSKHNKSQSTVPIISSPSYSGVKSRSVDGIPENVGYIYRDHNLKSTRWARFQVDSINERLRVVNIAPSKTTKTLRDRHVNGLSLIMHWTVLDCCLRQSSSSTGPKEQRIWSRTGSCGAIVHVCMGPSTLAAMPVGWALPKFWFAYGTIGSFGEEPQSDDNKADVECMIEQGQPGAAFVSGPDWT
ncbi:hypothetical protein BGY98DRAFT_1177976 [Russula aff. rugulosa BPL654]|nr:hypothetical protein BGY98DRAFT_1177976 [Russula aff. rugulosa BPL654]